MQPNGMNSFGTGFHLLQQFNQQGQNTFEQGSFGNMAQHFTPAPEGYAPVHPQYQDMSASSSTLHMSFVQSSAEAPVEQHVKPVSHVKILSKPANTQNREGASVYSRSHGTDSLEVNNASLVVPSAKETQEFQALFKQPAKSKTKLKTKPRDLVSIPEHLRHPNESSLKRISRKNLEGRKPVPLTKELLYPGERVGQFISKKEFQTREARYKKLTKALERNTVAENVNVTPQQSIQQLTLPYPDTINTGAPLPEVQMPSELDAFNDFMLSFDSASFDTSFLDMFAGAVLPQSNGLIQQPVQSSSVLPVVSAPLSSEYLQHVSNVAAGIPSIEPQAKFVQPDVPTLMQHTQIVDVHAQQAPTGMGYNIDQFALGLNVQPQGAEELAKRFLVPGLPNGYQPTMNLSRQTIVGPGT